MRAFPTWAGILRNHDIIRLQSELLSALRQSQDNVGADGELRFLELLHAAVHPVRIAVDEKDAERPASVSSRSLRSANPPIGLNFVLTQF